MDGARINRIFMNQETIAKLRFMIDECNKGRTYFFDCTEIGEILDLVERQQKEIAEIINLIKECSDEAFHRLLARVDKCQKCGYQNHPCDLVCDRCGGEIG